MTQQHPDREARTINQVLDVTYNEFDVRVDIVLVARRGVSRQSEPRRYTTVSENLVTPQPFRFYDTVIDQLYDLDRQRYTTYIDRQLYSMLSIYYNLKYEICILGEDNFNLP